MGIAITVKGANYEANAVTVPTPPIVFDVLSNGVGNISHNSVTHVLTAQCIVDPTRFEFVQTTEASSAKITVPTSNPVTIHALCIGGDASGNAIVVNMNGDGAVRKFDKSGLVGDIVNLYVIPSTPPNVAKGNQVTITHTETHVTIAYGGSYSFNLLYSHVPTLVVKCMGVLVYSTPLNTFLFEKVS